MELRPYQKEAVKAIHTEWQQGHKKTLLVLPTGCHAIGQSVMLSNGFTYGKRRYPKKDIENS